MLMNILRAEWKNLLMVAVWVVLGFFAGVRFTDGRLTAQALAFSQEKNGLQQAFNRQSDGWQQARLAAAGRYAADLQAALAQQARWQKKADDLSGQLAQKEREYTRNLNDLRRKQTDAIQQDGAAYTGIGPAGLQLWREALGYGAEPRIPPGQQLSDPTGLDAGHSGHAARAGLSPAGLISHGAQYGHWCLTLRDRLITLKEFYKAEP